MKDEMTAAQIENAVEMLRRNNVPPYQCPECGVKYYVAPPRGWNGEELLLVCECGAERLLTTPEQAL
jgi:hypothetical protein